MGRGTLGQLVLAAALLLGVSYIFGSLSLLVFGMVGLLIGGAVNQVKSSYAPLIRIGLLVGAVVWMVWTWGHAPLPPMVWSGSNMSLSLGSHPWDLISLTVAYLYGLVFLK